MKKENPKDVTNKSVIKRMLKEEYWKAVKIGKKFYFRTFQDNVITFD